MTVPGAAAGEAAAGQEGRIANALVPLLLLLTALALGWYRPQWLVPLRPGIVPGLAIIMFVMGMALTGAQVVAMLRQPRWLVLGVVLQYLIMPLAAWGLAAVLALPKGLAVGLVLVGTCPGGTASNVMVYLARGNLALSVAMTTVSTLASPLLTPLLAWLLLSTSVDVPLGDMLRSIVLVVILPLTVGMVARSRWPRLASDGDRWLARLAMLIVALIVGTIVALNREALPGVGALLLLAVVLHNGIGLGAGYALAILLGADPQTRRAIALEVGMQNSGLATVLALKFFAPLAALPAALFSVWHNVSGLCLASLWRWQPTHPGQRPRCGNKKSRSR